MKEQDRELALYQEQITELTKYRQRANEVLAGETADNILSPKRKKDLEDFIQIINSVLDNRFDFNNRPKIFSDLIYKAVALELSK